MRAKLDLVWRTLITAFGFLMFGLGGLLLRVLVFPTLQLFARNRVTRALWAKWIIRHAFLVFVRTLRLLRYFDYELHNVGRLQRGGLLIMANHPSLLDVVLLMSVVPQADCVVKASLWQNPFTAGPVRAAGYISNSGGPDLIDACIATLRAGNNLIIFPEGTRSKPKQALSFQRGAANISIRGAVPITPVLIVCHPPLLIKGEKWYRIPRQRPKFVVQVLEDIDITAYIQPSVEKTLAARQLTAHIQNFFTKELLRYDGVGT